MSLVSPLVKSQNLVTDDGNQQSASPYTRDGARAEFIGDYYYTAFARADGTGYKAQRSLIGSNPIVIEESIGTGPIPADLTNLTYN